MELYDVVRKENGDPKPDLISHDKVHPTDKGHELMAQVAFKTFTQSDDFNQRVNKIRRGLDEDYNNGIAQALATFKAEHATGAPAAAPATPAAPAVPVSPPAPDPKSSSLNSKKKKLIQKSDSPQ